MPARSVQSAARRQVETADLSPIIDCESFRQLQSGALRNERVQVDHGAVFPQKDTAFAASEEITGEGLAHHLLVLMANA